MHKLSSSRRRCALPTVVALSAIRSSFTTSAIAAATLSKSTREFNLRGYRQHPSILLQLHQHQQQQQQRPRRAEKEETNDDGNTIVPLHPFSLRLSNLPSTSPILAMAAANTNTANDNNNDNNDNNGNNNELTFITYSTMDNAMNSLLQYITTIGAQTYTESGMYKERFLEWNVGTVWSVGSSEHSEHHTHDDQPAATTNTALPRVGPPSAQSRNSENNDNTVVQQSPSAAATATSTTILTVGYNGTITLKGIYWDDPEPRELTEYLVRDLNGDATIQLGLLDRLRPLVCNAGDLIGNTCNVGLELVVSSSSISDDAVPMVSEKEDGAQDVAALEKEESDPDGDQDPDPEPPVDGDDNSEVVIDNNPPVDEAQYWAVGEGSSEPVKFDTTTIPSPDFIDTSTNTLVANTPSDSQYPTLASARGTTNQDDTNNTQSKMQMILPVILASIASLSIILVAGLLYHRRRKRLRDPEAALAPQDELVLNTTDDETLPENHEHVIMQLQQQPPSSSWANNAYDVITSSKKSKNLQQSYSYSYSNNNTSTTKNRGGDSSTSAATAGNSVAATSPAAAAAGAFPAPPSSKNNKATATTSQSQRKTLDDMIDSFSDGDSSFVSDSSASNSNTGAYNNGSGGANHGSVFSGLTGVLGDSPTSSPTPLEDREFNDRILAAKRKLAEKDGAINNNGSNTTSPRSVQKQEDFEGTYRTRSAMAKLSLKKDILHVACDTHDAPENDSGSEGNMSATRGGDSTVDYDVVDDPQQQNLGMSYGVTRTISPKKSTHMMKQQRNAEKLSLMTRSRYFSSGGKSSSSSSSRGPPSSSKQNYGNVQKEQNRKEKVENDRETSKDLILPVDFKRSDSVDLVSKSISDVSSEDEIGDVYD